MSEKQAIRKHGLQEEEPCRGPGWELLLLQSAVTQAAVLLAPGSGPWARACAGSLVGKDIRESPMRGVVPTGRAEARRGRSTGQRLPRGRGARGASPRSQQELHPTRQEQGTVHGTRAARRHGPRCWPRGPVQPDLVPNFSPESPRLHAPADTTPGSGAWLLLPPLKVPSILQIKAITM